MDAQSKIILASGSPRRKLLFEKLGIPFQVVAADVDERNLPYKTPREFAIKAAYTKAMAVEDRFAEGTIIVAADTIVVLDAVIYGKPQDEAEGRAMLARLAGRTHQVITGVAVKEVGRSTLLDAVAANVHIRELSQQEIADYVATGEPMDKAGAYAAQGLGRTLVSRIDGDYFTVVGLPAARLVEMLSLHVDVTPYRAALRLLTPEAFEADGSNTFD